MFGSVCVCLSGHARTDGHLRRSYIVSSIECSVRVNRVIASLFHCCGGRFSNVLVRAPLLLRTAQGDGLKPVLVLFGAAFLYRNNRKNIKSVASNYLSNPLSSYVRTGPRCTKFTKTSTVPFCAVKHGKPPPSQWQPSVAARRSEGWSHQRLRPCTWAIPPPIP